MERWQKKHPVWEKRQRRYATMAALYRKGWTLRQIGEKYGCSRENVRQCMATIGVNGSDSGWMELVKERKKNVRAAREARSVEKWGCSLEQYLAIRRLKKPTRAFCDQQQKARNRSIPWELTLWQWWSIWIESGKWEKRGNKPGQYVMCRRYDIGPYAVGNVFIATNTDNLLQARNMRGHLPSNVRNGTPEARILRESKIYWWTHLR